MNDFETLELSTETLRELSRDEMEQVAGGTVGAVTRTCNIINTGLILAVAGAATGIVTQKLDSVGC